MTTELIHYGTPRHSGRYPWGSGKDPYQSSMSFIGYVDNLRKEGLSEREIAEGMGMSMRELRERRTIARNEIKKNQIYEAHKLKEKQMSNVAIGEKMGIPESSVRNLLKPQTLDRAKKLDNTVNELKRHLDRNPYLDVSKGTELYMGISEEHMKAALTKLRDEGYRIDTVKERQLGTGHETTVTVLSPPGTEYRDLYVNKADIGSINSITEDKGLSFRRVEPPKSMDSKRVGIRYAEDGGADEDGLIYVRRGVDDISLGDKRYAQVRLAVDDTHFIKGVAIYKDGLPKGVDVVFNTNKKRSANKLDALKPLEDNPDLPFGAVTKPRFYTDKNGKVQQSIVNVIYEEGDWQNWDRNLASQVLSKQTTSLAKRQLSLDTSFRQQELREIKSLTNPTIKRHLLNEFANNADSAAVKLQAAALPRQETKVIIPINSLRDNEIYAPTFRQGENVALIRFPHGGRFEIPELKVNNRNTEGRTILSNAARDAVGINSRVASQLSGADFDGDTVLVIPNNDGKIKSSKPLQALKDFDPKVLYQRDYDTITDQHKEHEMGEVSNLITDMTIRGANYGEIARAVKHSMVVIDSKKHKLDYKQSAIDHGIAELRKKYQADPDNPRSRGASTLISRANSPKNVPERKLRSAKDGGPVDKDTGELRWVNTGASFTNEDGKVVHLTDKVPKLALTNDAYTLSSGTRIEAVYADYSNTLKAMANDARRTAVNIPNLKYNSQAAQTYAPQRASLRVKVDAALKNAPLERRAQRLADAQVKAIRANNPNITKEKLKEVGNKALVEMRARVGAKKETVNITPLEWEAIQAGAVSDSFLRDVIRNSDPKQIREYATPRATVSMTPAKIARARSMIAMGYPQSEVADALGVSTSTLSKAL